MSLASFILGAYFSDVWRNLFLYDIFHFVPASVACLSETPALGRICISALAESSVECLLSCQLTDESMEGVCVCVLCIIGARD